MRGKLLHKWKFLTKQNFWTSSSKLNKEESRKISKEREIRKLPPRRSCLIHRSKRKRKKMNRSFSRLLNLLIPTSQSGQIAPGINSSKNKNLTKIENTLWTVIILTKLTNSKWRKCYPLNHSKSNRSLDEWARLKPLTKILVFKLNLLARSIRTRPKARVVLTIFRSLNLRWTQSIIVATSLL